MTPIRLLPRLALLGVVLFALDVLAPDARAGIGSFFSGITARTRIVQFCVIIAGLSLLIILKKFSPDSRASAPKMTYALSQRQGDGTSSPDRANADPALPSPSRADAPHR